MPANASRPRPRGAAPAASAATVSDGAAKARPVQNASRKLQLNKELFFAGFPCQQPHPRTEAAEGASVAAVRPLSRQFVRGFFQQYGSVEAFFYDESRGMGSVVFVDGADAESCYLAVHLSFIPATTADGGVGQPTWEQDEAGEAMAQRRARASDVLLCLEFAHCCPFVHPVLLTRDAEVHHSSSSSSSAVVHEVPGGELSRATLLHRFPQLLAAPSAVLPVAPYVVARWRTPAAQSEPHHQRERKQRVSARVEVLSDGDGEEETEEMHATASTHTPDGLTPTATPALVLEGPTFPGRSLPCTNVAAALWRLLRPSHVAAAAGNAVTVLDLWWEYYNLYLVHKTQPFAGKMGDSPYVYAQRPSSWQEVAAVQRRAREDAHGDEAAAQQVLQRLVHDHAYHNVFAYLLVKQKFKYDAAWASLMRDVYRPAVVQQLEAWRQQQQRGEGEGEHAAAAATADTPVDYEVRRRRVVAKALHEVIEAKPTNRKDVELVRRAEQTWLTLPRTIAAANVMENVHFLGKVRRGEVNRDATDKDMSTKPPLPSSAATLADGQDGDAPVDLRAAYPSMSARQREEQRYAEVLQNIDGYVALGTAEEMVAMCEEPKLFRYAKGHIGYEEAHRLPSYWRAYVNALWVPLIAFLLLGYTSYYIVDRLGISKVNEQRQKDEQRREFQVHLREFLDQQQRVLDEVQGGTPGVITPEKRAAMRKMNQTMQRAAEAARKAGGRFNIELRGDL